MRSRIDVYVGWVFAKGVATIFEGISILPSSASLIMDISGKTVSANLHTAMCRYRTQTAAWSWTYLDPLD